MRRPRILDSAIFRIVAVYVLFFAAGVAALGALAYVMTSAALMRHVDSRIDGEAHSLREAYRSGGLPRLVMNVNANLNTPRTNELYILVLDARGRRLVGNLPVMPMRPGWSIQSYVENESDEDVGRMRVFLIPLSNGGGLAVAADLESVEDTQETILDGVVSAFGAIVLLGTVGGIALSGALLKRVDTIRSAAEAISAGDLSQRVPLRGNGDDFDRLSQTLNHMLDRIAELMEGLRQVSTDIAHDLKTPLARLRQRLENAQRHPGSAETYGMAFERAIADVDEILTTFSALLRIAQIEAGMRRAGFREIDLSGVFLTVVEAFSPAAEDKNQTLAGNIDEGVRIIGDRELLTQMVANLVENAIRHTPAGTRIIVSLRGTNEDIVGRVADNGPGVEPKERGRIFQRLYRSERSRSTPGSGLGLSLVKAIAVLHSAAIELRDARPGLAVVIRFNQQNRGVGKA